MILQLECSRLKFPGPGMAFRCVPAYPRFLFWLIFCVFFCLFSLFVSKCNQLSGKVCLWNYLLYAKWDKLCLL